MMGEIERKRKNGVLRSGKNREHVGIKVKPRLRTVVQGIHRV